MEVIHLHPQDCMGRLFAKVLAFHSNCVCHRYSFNAPRNPTGCGNRVENGCLDQAGFSNSTRLILTDMPYFPFPPLP